MLECWVYFVHLSIYPSILYIANPTGLWEPVAYFRRLWGTRLERTPLDRTLGVLSSTLFSV